MVTIYLEAIAISVDQIVPHVPVPPHVTGVFVESTDPNVNTRVATVVSIALVLHSVHNVSLDDMVHIVKVFALLAVSIFFATRTRVNAQEAVDMDITLMKTNATCVLSIAQNALPTISVLPVSLAITDRFVRILVIKDVLMNFARKILESVLKDA